jgi:hypothetical protein
MSPARRLCGPNDSVRRYNVRIDMRSRTDNDQMRPLIGLAEHMPQAGQSVDIWFPLSAVLTQLCGAPVVAIALQERQD